MASLHSTLTGADLHEPKGADGAAANTVYVANGLGSGVWAKPAAVNTTIADPNNVFAGTDVEAALYEAWREGFVVDGVFTDVSNVETVLLPIPYSCTIVSIKMILSGSITVANSNVTVTRSDGAAMGVQAIAFSGSAEGTTFNFTPSGNNVFVGGTHNYIKLVSDGGSTTTAKLYVQALLRRT